MKNSETTTQRLSDKEMFNSLFESKARKFVEETLAAFELFTDREEFGFVKTTLETPEGGSYLIQIQHVSGPKISLRTDQSEES